ncbi:biotin holocarboxylase synthetase [Lunasporangiospora selenospora]|uniref:Biotin holocarboxylase synthetase n=1 Tax=Lunasporangiospora selenospora TaxID=979761 RepID=A0A9P6FRU0_9FUNG|nr:biotin holocarboxylase synthetase [Lunasporangiospora selenospora]
MNILIYSGEGTSRTSLAHTVRTLKALLGHHYDVMKIDAKGLLSEPWEESTSLLVIPGGRDLPYTRDLSGSAIDKIRGYVKSGGKFWGICAGAYFSSGRVCFEPNTPYEVKGSRELQFFPGECRGAVYPGFVYDSELGAKAVEVHLEPGLSQPGLVEKTRLYFNGGGYFVDAEATPGIEVLATYHDVANDEDQGRGAEADKKKRASIIACQVEKGLALLSGVHPEYDAAHLDAANPEYGPLPNVVSRLLSSDQERVVLLKALLKRLGLKLNEPEPSVTSTATTTQADQESQAPEAPPGAIMGIPDYTPLYLASANPNLQRAIAETLKSLSTPERLIKESNDTFQLIASPFEDVPKHTTTITEAEDGAGEEERIIKNVVLCPDGPPDPTLTPEFSMVEYFSHIENVRSVAKSRNPQTASQNPFLRAPELTFGNWLMFGQVVSSTQTMLEKNFGLCQQLPDGFVCNATTQLAGRGRGRNSWISPPGCLQFSMVMRHPIQVKHASAVFVQYLVALAVVESVCSLEGYEELPLKLKWPNDIYAEAPLEEEEEKLQGKVKKMVKIGGVLVNSNFNGSDFLLVIGCGVNTTNPNPTTSLNHLIRHHNKKTGKTLALFTQEKLLAHVLVKLNEMYNTFLNGKDILQTLASHGCDGDSDDDDASSTSPSPRHYIGLWIVEDDCCR